MPHVVTDNCQRCRFTDCVTHCPVQCFHADDERVYIDPEVCIDCSACVPICPVQAIYDSLDLPDAYAHELVINAQRSHLLPVISAHLPPLPTAESRRAELGL
ncbi:indolepyruvate ferredoxin oxidoreductase subunit alpha [Caballeronia mineralivorans]|jgi:ferredoxin|uniref:indolepyruvate ferredoxin oxidoreductase subunit alpha n=1 Tax=Caballeronia mineralivorans TaxID=2010198 RepID=UPI0023F11867|nr:ferredoxin family protein [Caballeronia mineralivorans]MDB5780845.1 ferredoxin [Caballeronia mineralivorans]MEA3102617.1 ferredoxin [Caballeronia mineralivorans]